MRTSAPITTNCDGQGQNQPAPVGPPCDKTETLPHDAHRLFGAVCFFVHGNAKRKKGLDFLNEV